MSSREASPSRPNAELGAAYLCAEAGISNAVVDNQAAYLSGWLSGLRADRKLLILLGGVAPGKPDTVGRLN
jgi:antirestriction protein ArdC